MRNCKFDSEGTEGGVETPGLINLLDPTVHAGDDGRLIHGLVTRYKAQLVQERLAVLIMQAANVKASSSEPPKFKGNQQPDTAGHCHSQP